MSLPRATTGRVLEVVAATVVSDHRLLLVSKHEAPDVFYLPGGKRDDGESAEACLRRETATLDRAPALFEMSSRA